MQALDLPDHGVKTKHGAAGTSVFDPVRRRWVALTPEEWVRQHVINHLVHDLGCPASLIAVETKLVLNGMTKRADIVVYDPQADHVIRAEDMVGKAGYTPYEGFVTRGSIAQVWLRGHLAVDHGAVLSGCEGKYIVRGKNSL